MSNRKSKNVFEPLSLPRRELPALANRYRVYKSFKDYTVVDAGSALEALKASGLEKAYKIEPDAIFFNSLLKRDVLSGGETAAPAPAADAATPPQ